MANGWRLPASLRAWVRQTRQRQCRGKRHLSSKTKRRNKKPTAACHSWFFLYWAKENEPAESPGSFAAGSRGIKSGTERAYSSKEAPWREWRSWPWRRITRDENTPK